MPSSTINGIDMRYEVLGDHGSWVALSPGGRRGLDEIRSLATRVADAGYRVLIQDRRNCGAGEVSIGGSSSEHAVWSDDLHALLSSLHALPAFIGGSSSGCRMSLDFAMRYPQAVRGLLLWRVTGGAFAVERLTEKYYGEFIRAAREGGMRSVCASEHFGELIAARPSNRARLMALDPERFIEAMSAWDRDFRVGANQPVIGASAEQLASMMVPACIVPGNDKTHPRSVAKTLAGLMPKSELHFLMGEDVDRDVAEPASWTAKESGLAEIFVRWLKRHD